MSSSKYPTNGTDPTACSAPASHPGGTSAAAKPAMRYPTIEFRAQHANVGDRGCGDGVPASPNCRFAAVVRARIVTVAAIGLARGTRAGPSRARRRERTAVKPIVTTAIMMTPPKNSANANFHPSSDQKRIRIARFILVEETRNDKNRPNVGAVAVETARRGRRAVRTCRRDDPETGAVEQALEARSEIAMHRRRRQHDLNDRRDQKAEDQSEEAVPKKERCLREARDERMAERTPSAADRNRSVAEERRDEVPAR